MSIQRAVIGWSNRERAARVSGLHVVPSFTLEITNQGYLGAGFYVLGNDKEGSVSSQNTLYMRVTGNRAVVVEDQPGQDW